MIDGTEALRSLFEQQASNAPHVRPDVAMSRMFESSLAESPTFYEFFAGGGMARAGLGPGWRCIFANDFDNKKAVTYADNWGADALKTKDVGTVSVDELPGTPDLVWASFPCQDLSLAGMGAGLRGDRSGTFWPFWKLITKLSAAERGPRLLILENVCGTLTSHDGKDFTAIANALTSARYRFGAVVIDAADFVPQSRPRLFIIAAAESETLPEALHSPEPSEHWHTRSLRVAYDRLPSKARQNWVWWRLPTPPVRNVRLVDIIEENPLDVEWHSQEETKRLLGMMSTVNLAKVNAAQKMGKSLIGTVYKRTRRDERGSKVQRAEIRFDGIAGCLRTSAGGSSRQVIVVVKGNRVRSRLISARETARLMGLPDSYRLPQNYNEAYHLTGDGVVVPVVRFLAASLLEPILSANTAAALVGQ
jgi:DNA (cytosine-5)-methyltransferase 1